MATRLLCSAPSSSIATGSPSDSLHYSSPLSGLVYISCHLSYNVNGQGLKSVRGHLEMIFFSVAVGPNVSTRLPSSAQTALAIAARAFPPQQFPSHHFLPRFSKLSPHPLSLKEVTEEDEGAPWKEI